MRFVVDAKTGRRTNDSPAVVVNRMSWRRLAETLRDAGHVKSTEELTHFVVSDDGIELRFTTKGKS